MTSVEREPVTVASKAYTAKMAVDLQIASDVQLSADGAWVAFCLAPIGHRHHQPACTIYVVPSDASAAPRPITTSDHNNISPRWSPDGTEIAFLSDQPKRGEQQVHRVSREGGVPARLTNLDGGVQSIAWSPDGSQITFTARRKSLAGQRESESEVNVASERARPRAIASIPATGGAARLIGPPQGHVWSYRLSPDGSRYAALVSPTERLDDSADQTWLAVLPAGGGNEVKALTRFMRGSDQLSWSPDGNWIMVLDTRRPDHLQEHIHLISPDTGDVTTFDDRDKTPYWAGFAGETILVLNVDEQRSSLETTDLRGAEWEPVELNGELAGRWIMPQINLSPDGSVQAFLAASPSSPPDVFVRGADGEVRRLTDLNPQLRDVALATMEEVIWEGRDGRSIHGWLLRPPGREQEQSLPLVVDIHGGPTMAWGNWFHGTWHDWGQVLAANGFAVLLPNPRGSTGKGQNFSGANQADLGGEDFQDIMLGVNEIIARGIADPERLGIGGWSYGGFLTALTVVRTDRFKAAVAGAAVTNWPSKVGTTDIRPFNEWNFPGPLHRSPDAYWVRSPVRYLKNAKTPTLIVHGEADERVPVTQGHEFYLGLRAAGVETDLITYPRQGHSFHERAFQLDLLERLVAWFNRHLKETPAQHAPS